MKDYYKILNVKPDSPSSTIKQSYRKLALKYHPDKNPDDELAAAVFSDIAEAYSVLSNQSSRNNYNYQRFHTAPEEYIKPAETIESLIDKAGKLKNQVLKADPFRFNREALLYSIKQLFPPDITMLTTTNPTLQKAFLNIVSWCSNYLNSTQTKNLMQTLQPVFAKHEWLQQQLQHNASEQLKKEKWEVYKVVLVVLLTIIICVIIFFAVSHK